MERKEFYLNNTKYIIELHPDYEIKVYSIIDNKLKHLYGKQKNIIVKKLFEIIENDKNNIFEEDITSYVKDYIRGITRDASKNTRYLGKILFKYLCDKI